MKKIIYLSFILMFSVSLLNATNVKEVNNKEKDLKIEKIEKESIDSKTVLLTRYRGRCLDGHTFTFTASSGEIAQNFVNAYCSARTEFEVQE
jgi:hypothetical protein